MKRKKPKPRLETRDIIRGIRMRQSESDKLDDLAYYEGISAGAYVRMIVERNHRRLPK